MRLSPIQHELLLIDLIVLASEKVLRVGGSVALAVLGYLHISARLLAKSDLLVGVSICLLPGKTGKAFNCWQGQIISNNDWQSYTFFTFSSLSSGLSRLSTRIPLLLELCAIGHVEVCSKPRSSC